MFFQVGIPPCDQPSLRFLWREDNTSEVKILQNTRNNFGAGDSPKYANFVLQQNARENVEIFPEASRAVLTRFYMNNYLKSFENHKDARRVSKDLVDLLIVGGFCLTKFVSNVPANGDSLNPSRQK